MTREEAEGYAAEYQLGEPMGDLARTLLATMTELEQVKGAEREAVMQSLASLGQAQEAYEAQKAAETALAAMTEREGVLSDMLRKAANRLDWCACLLHTDTARDQASTWAEETRAALQHKDDTHGPE